MPNAILTLNAGSSSIKFALFETGAREEIARAFHGKVEAIGSAPHLVAQDKAGKVLHERRWPKGGRETHEDFLPEVLGLADAHLGADELIGIGHRIVHGGPRHIEPAPITTTLLQELERLVPLAPLHQPHNLAPIRAIARLRSTLTQVACFDTAFHHTLPAVATRFALPRKHWHEDLRRYGFHGLSYEFIARRLAEIAPQLSRARVIVAHLGNGASLCAMRDGRSVETTMSLTALDGLVMGTRCGSIDPGAILYLQQTHGMSADQVQDVLYNKSGLLGVSEIASDMRTLLASPDDRAREAIELFVYRLAREAGGLVSVLGGLDGFVFTAGIGEHAPEIRERVAAHLGWLGLALDEEANRRGEQVISKADSRVAVHVIATDEEAMIARHTLTVIRSGAGRQAFQ